MCTYVSSSNALRNEDLHAILKWKVAASNVVVTINNFDKIVEMNKVIGMSD